MRGTILLPLSQPLRSAAAYIRGTRLRTICAAFAPRADSLVHQPEHAAERLPQPHPFRAGANPRLVAGAARDALRCFQGPFSIIACGLPTTNHQTHDPRSYKQTKNRYGGFVSGFRGRMNLIHVPVVRTPVYTLGG
ncbi:hypothetical protein B0H13DRAFT_2477539 [Mycena leptocephala]|nr:hypothetical protein B0H13DRAFT_2477539 [Mycena leptocephala]